MDKYAFFLDIDGTLLAAGGVPQENIDAIKKARSLGHKVFVNSGRSMGFIPQPVREIEFDGYIVGIGCYITYGDEILVTECIPADEVAKMFDKFTDSGKAVVLEGETAIIGNELCDNDDCIRIKNGTEYLEKYSHERITKFFLPHTFEAHEIQELEKHYTVFQHPTYLEYAPKGYSKATGMETVLKKCGIPRERSVAIGDSANDIDMLNYAGISVAVGNADDKIKAICKKVTAHAKEGGVGKAIYEIISSGDKQPL